MSNNNRRKKNTLFTEQAAALLENLQKPETFKALFLPLVIEAKEAAHNDLLENSPQYNTANEKEWELYGKFEEQLKKTESPETCRLFDEYLEAEEATDIIWAEEMYLRGIQDAVAFIMLTSKKNVFDTTGISIL